MVDDERKLVELFSSAVRDAPPASFDDRDVARAAERITRRRRSMLVGGGGVAAVVIAVGLFFGTGGFGHTFGGPVSSSGAAMSAAQQSDTSGTRFKGPLAETENGPSGHGTRFSSESPMQGGNSNGRAGPGAGSTSQGCGPMDGELAVALANELPSVGAPAANPAGLSCPAGTRSATYAVPHGSVTALLVPPAQAPLIRSGTLASTPAPAASGAWTVVVLTQPDSGYATSLFDIANKIAAKF